MELVCEKFGDKMESDTAECGHPSDYCKFRQSCLIHFIGQENKREQEKPNKTKITTNQKS